MFSPLSVNHRQPSIGKSEGGCPTVSKLCEPSGTRRCPTSARFWQMWVFVLSRHTHGLMLYQHSKPSRDPQLLPPAAALARPSAPRQDWKWSSFRHYAKAEIGPVEIESQWTADRRNGRPRKAVADSRVVKGNQKTHSLLTAADVGHRREKSGDLGTSLALVVRTLPDSEQVRLS